jgi:hypothetical protein
MLEDITTEWNDRYNTHVGAKPDSQLRHVVDVLAIRVANGHLRGSDFDGVFEVADVPKPFSIHTGDLRVEVKVGWFGMKPKTTWSHITLNGEWELIRNYSGKVVHNLSAH